MPDFRPPRPPQSPQESAAEVYLKSHTADILNFRQTEAIAPLLDHLKVYAEDKGRSLTTSQLRNIFSKVKPIATRQKLQLIRPKLAYVAARQKSGLAEQVVNFLESIIKKVETDAQVKDFVAFFEAFVAYHKLAESKDKKAGGGR